MTPEEFRRYGHIVVDRIADYRASAGAMPVMSRVKPGEIRAQLPAAPPVEPEPFDEILADLDRVIMPGLSHWQHPSFFGYFPSNGELSAVLGDFLSTGFGVLGLSWQSSPALTELEEVSTDWMRQMMGLDPAWQGVIQDTASTSTLIALVSARERTTRMSAARGGLQAEPTACIVYTTAQAHSSVEKAALLAGFGRDHVRIVAHDTAHAMDPGSLVAIMAADASEGLRPCAVVATTGTTASTAVDPLAAVVAAAKAHDSWVHVDAAMAGSAMILPECRWMWDGIEGADSLVVNVHKWLGVPFDCSLYYVRDPHHLVNVMSTNPSYLQNAADTDVRNLRDWGLALGRRFRALKLWMLIREQGVSRLQDRLRRDLSNARALAGIIGATPDWRVVAPVPLQTLCVLHEPPGLDGAALDDHTRRWVDRINESGAAYLTPAILDERWMARISIGALNTEWSDVERLWTTMQRAVAAVGTQP
ncbi:MAG: aspartate aminotransferase family protein [Gemmatimonadales bacterium]|nr:aspartate aminotransferase family protein [Gemmatimonadales bacterium]